MATIEWARPTEDDLPQLAGLAAECLRADGGLPLLTDESMLRRLFLDVPGIAGRDDIGDIVAVASLGREEDGGPSAAMLIQPGQVLTGAGEQLIAWIREHSTGAPIRLAMESTSVETEQLMAEHGLHRVFAETVMRHRLRRIPRVPLPAGLQTVAFTEETAHAFYLAYSRSFADRPGFPGTPEEEWLSWLTSEPEFLPSASRVALDEAEAPVGFVTLGGNWIDQVGVIPPWRGRRLGAHLVARSLTAIQRAGGEVAWLAVTVDNPAADLYCRLGFKAKGTRARYADRAT
ncbi:MAG: GNAT family N-acetyltransferase [Tetrasphaera sp.]|nr:GNAT family N-acetyltransferase [Tetrasphaera sp.]